MKKLGKKLFFRLFNLYPPFLGAGIRVSISSDVKTVTVSMKLRFWNRNYVNTHYGGSLYSMCDPFFMFLLMENLGRGFIVWDKHSTITFRKPGRGRVHARFFIPEEMYADLRRQAEKGKKLNPRFTVDVLDESGDTVASVEKTLSVRMKQLR